MHPTSNRQVSPETLSQAGSGALLAAVAVVDLWLTAASGAWYHQFGASLVAAAGVALLARGAAAIAPPPLRLRPARRPVPEPVGQVLVTD
jgi:hypothetical protein